jgi:hypothetical protein
MSVPINEAFNVVCGSSTTSSIKLSSTVSLEHRSYNKLNKLSVNAVFNTLYQIYKHIPQLNMMLIVPHR